MVNNNQIYIDNFFSTLVADDSNSLSDCCNAKALGEMQISVGRCSECLEMSTFSVEEI